MSIDTSDINVSIEKTLEVSNVDKERKIPFSSRVKSTYASESELPVPRMLSSFSPLSSFTKLLSPIAGIDNLSVTVPPPINGWTDYDNVSDNNNKTIQQFFSPCRSPSSATSAKIHITKFEKLESLKTISTDSPSLPPLRRYYTIPNSLQYTSTSLSSSTNSPLTLSWPSQTSTKNSDEEKTRTTNTSPVLINHVYLPSSLSTFSCSSPTATSTITNTSVNNNSGMLISSLSEIPFNMLDRNDDDELIVQDAE